MYNYNQQLLIDLFHAYFRARKNKGKTASALAFAVDYEKNLFEIYDEIINYRYEIKPSICFIVNKPVKREIFAANFRDRIVHHLLYGYLSPYFEKDFIKDSYSCRKNKGTLYGIKRADYFIRSCSQNYTKDCWVLKLDIRSYFMSIDKNILYKKVADKIKSIKNPNFDKKLITHLFHLVIHNDPTENARIKGRRQDWAGLPKSKSLFSSGKNKGLPIGNLTSQLCANVYLNEFDHFVKEELGFRYYGRYVDDMIFVHPDKNHLIRSIAKVKKHLQDNLGLTIHPRKIYLQRYQNGVSFLGVFIKPRRIYVGTRMKGNFFEYLYSLISQGDKMEIGKKEVSAINSYLGIMSHFNSFKLRKKIISKVQEFIEEKVVIHANFQKVLLK